MIASSTSGGNQRPYWEMSGKTALASGHSMFMEVIAVNKIRIENISAKYIF